MAKLHRQFSSQSTGDSGQFGVAPEWQIAGVPNSIFTESAFLFSELVNSRLELNELSKKGTLINYSKGRV
jgi:hypothetical protein